MAASAGGIKAGKAWVAIEAVDRTAFVLRRISQRFRTFGREMADLGRSVLTKSLLALTPAFLSSRLFAGFDDSMRKVEARSAGTASELGTLREQAKELGRTTAFTARQIAELQAKLAQKGFNRSQLVRMTDAVTFLARSGGDGMDLMEDAILASDLVSGTLRAFQMEAEQAGHVADVFTFAVNNSNFDLQSLIDTMKYASPIARQYGLSLEDTVSTVALLRDVNLDASTAGTAFRNMLLELSDAAGREKFNAALKKMTGNTINMVDAAGNLRRLPDILFEIGEATKSLGTAERGNLLTQLFGKRAITAAMVAGGGKNPFSDFRKRMEDIDGIAKKTSDTMEAGLGGSFRMALSAIEGTAIALGEAIEGPFKAFVGVLTKIAGAMTSWIETNPDVVASITGVLIATAATGAVLITAGLAVKFLAFALGGLALVAKLVGVAFAVLTSPITLVVAAITAAGVAFFRFTESGRSALSGISTALTGFLSGIRAVLGQVMQSIAANRFDLAWQIVWLNVRKVWLTATGWLLDIWHGFANTILKFMSDLWGGIEVIWSEGIFAIRKLLHDLETEFLVTRQKTRNLNPFARETLDPEVIRRERDGYWRDEEINHRADMDRIGEGMNARNQALDDAEKDAKAKRERERKKVDADIRKTEEDIAKAAAGTGGPSGPVGAMMAAAGAIAAARAAQQSRAAEAAAGVSATPAFVSPEALRGLERGTLEAAEQAQKNRSNSQLSQMIDLSTQQLETQKSIDDGIEGLSDSILGV